MNEREVWAIADQAPVDDQMDELWDEYVAVFFDTAPEEQTPEHLRDYLAAFSNF